MVVLDSNHTHDHVLKELENYSQFVKKGSYLIVFDTIIPRNIRLAEVPYYGEPVISFDKNCKGAQSYIDLAREILIKDDTQRPIADDNTSVEVI